jgi:hypothetical protein
MALIFRGKCAYYIRSIRRDGKVTSEYIGSGRLALAAARIDAERGEARAADAAECQRERKRLEDVDTLLAGLCSEAVALGHATLEAAGYHQHKRQWRKRRMSAAKAERTPKSFKSWQPPGEPMTMGEAGRVLRRAIKGDKKVLPKLQELLDRSPSVRAHFLDGELTITSFAEDAVLKQSCGTDLLVHEIQSRDLDRTAEELAGADATPVEKLLARRAALCWHTVNLYEWLFATKGAKGVELAQGLFFQRTIDVAHRRLVQTIRTLELVRRLARPAHVAVNVTQSVSVEAPAAPPAESDSNRMSVAELLNAAPRG